jgi:hypothetical protein
VGRRTGKTGAPAAPAENKPAEYVGSTTCQSCHEDIFNAFQKNPHQSVETGKKRGWETKACESCHGPGSKHAESADAGDLANPGKQKPADADRSCLKCHLNQPTHAGRIQSSHVRNQVACVECHAIHKNGPNGWWRASGQRSTPSARGANHPVGRFQRPFKHRPPEGAMSCVIATIPRQLPAAMIQTVRSNEPLP